MDDRRAKWIARLRSEQFDLVVIGGGITGSSIARDAALRGLKTVLIEKNDFSSGTSSRSGKLVHGGARYLRYANFKLVFESANERNRLREIIAPHLVKAVKIVIPFHEQSRTGRALVGFGLFLYGCLSLFRNASRFRVMDKEELSKDAPGIRRMESVGALAFYDCRTIDTRLTIDTLKAAVEASAICLNYCEFKMLLSGGSKNFKVVRGLDHITKLPFEIMTTALVNATGVWADEILEKAEMPERFELKKSKGVHLVVKRDRLRHDVPMTLESFDDNRHIYIVPFGEYTLVGTTDTFFQGRADDCAVEQADVTYLLKILNWHFPLAKLGGEDIICRFVGLRPLIKAQENIPAEKASRDYEILASPAGMLSITGGKLTTARLMAKKTVDTVIDRFFEHRTFDKCRTLSPISGGHPFSVDKLKIAKIGNDSPIVTTVIEHLITRYGSNHSIILEYIEKNPKKARQIVSNFPYCYAELDYFIEHEFVLHLSDVMCRRTTLFWFGLDVAEKAAERISVYIGQKLGWDEERRSLEVMAYLEMVR